MRNYSATFDAYMNKVYSTQIYDENNGVLECSACIQYMTIEFINFF